MNSRYFGSSDIGLSNKITGQQFALFISYRQSAAAESCTSNLVETDCQWIYSRKQKLDLSKDYLVLNNFTYDGRLQRHVPSLKVGPLESS